MLKAQDNVNVLCVCIIADVQSGSLPPSAAGNDNSTMKSMRKHSERNDKELNECQDFHKSPF